MRSVGIRARTVACAVVLLSIPAGFASAAAAPDCGSTIDGQVTLTDNLLCQTGHGLRLAAGAVLDCNGHTITGAQQPDRYGIYLDGADDAAVVDCVVEGFDIGIRLRAAARATVRGAVTRDHTRYGIEITQGSRTALIADSTVADNGDEGIHVSGSLEPAEHWIAGNSVSGNGLEGIYLLRSHGNTVFGNTVRDNGRAGIYVKEADDNRIERNDLTRNPIQLVFDARRNLVIGNTIRLAGVALLITGDDNTVRENTVLRADIAGIRIAADSEPGTDGQPGRRNTVVCNRVSDNPIGVAFDAGATPNTLNANAIIRNGLGVDASAVPSPDPIDATGNWWGCAAGPGALGCDTVAGNVDVGSPLAANPPDADTDGGADACDSCTDTDRDGFANPGFPASTCPPDNCPSVANPEQRDTDGDGAGDPCDDCTDSDRDGFADPGFPGACPVDNCPSIPNASQADADRDGLGDACDSCTDSDRDGFANPGFPLSTCPIDNCPNVKNADQGDADRDGLGDRCDGCTDIDGDGAGDPGFSASVCVIDNCPAIPNANQVDADGDGLGDACDPCTDIDGDGRGVPAPGFPTSSCPPDNCAATPNPGQTDTDRDGVGDACDPCTDSDGDGFGDPGFPASTCPIDNCPADPAADQTDTDGDGVGDACDRCTDSDGDGFGDPGFPASTCRPLDNCPAAANRSQADADGDGLGDRCDPCTDTDGDGFGDPGFPLLSCELDNCPDVANPAQANADGDAYGDACDPCTDTDGDGFGDPGFPATFCQLDNCPAIANVDQLDADASGSGDVCECRAGAPGHCIPGGGAKRSDCLVEVTSAGPAPLNAKGTRTKRTLRCRDGDPRCDRDAAADGRCTFALAICFANDDPRLPQCRPVEMESFEVREPQAERSASADDRANALRLEQAASSAATAFDPGLAIRRHGKLLSDAISVPAGTNRCTRLVDVVVPAPVREGSRPVSRKLKLIGWSSDGRQDADKLTLECDVAP